MSQAGDDKSVVPQFEVASRMRMEFIQGAKDLTSKALEDFNQLLAKLMSNEFDLGACYKECANLIARDFGISTVAISAWMPSAQQFRYKALAGYRPEAVALYEKLWYTARDAMDEGTYPSHEISKQTRLYLSEDHPYAPGQEETFMRPALIGMRRRAATEALEADYLCTFYYGPKNELLGWIEYSGTRLGRLPDAATIRCVELAARILGIATILKGRPA